MQWFKQGVMRGAAAGRMFENDYNKEDGARRVGAESGRENEGEEDAEQSMLFIRKIAAARV